ncbi:MAG TPA: TIGR02147 family protein [Bdellovibrionota bacterium]|nr:TIGR02147 family protein [Bdellovibrionota bacterium]
MKAAQAKRPDLFTYQDYRAFLRDWIEHLKAQRGRQLSLRQLAIEAQVSTGYLSMVLTGKQALSAKALSKLLPHLGLDDQEQAFLELLRTIAESDNHAARMEALNRIQRFRAYGENQPREAETFQYLSRWYHVAIREMAGLKGLKLEPTEIQRRLKSRVPLKEIEEGLKFLVERGFIERGPGGAVSFPEKNIQCFEKVHQVALRQFHREMFRIAGETLDNTPIDERHVVGHTVAVSKETYSKIRELMEKTIRSIADLTRADRRADSVYHVALAAFPLTDSVEKKA